MFGNEENFWKPPPKVLWSNLSFEHLDNGHFLEVVTNRERDLDLHFNYAGR